MAAAKLVLRKKRSKDDTYPLAIRITRDRKSSFVHLGHSVKLSEWDATKMQVKKSHPNATRLNNFLIKKLSEANAKLLEVETEKTKVSSHTIKQKIKPDNGTTFFSQANAYIQKLYSAGKYNQYTADKPRVKHFKDFIGHDIAFQDITPTLLDRFKGYLRTKVKLSERSAVNHLVMIRSVFSQAIADNVVDQKYYPFGKGKTKIKFPESVKIGLTPEEVQRLEEVELTDEKCNHARNLWLFSFYFAGMRASDVLRIKWSDIQNDRLHYAMGKNNKAGSLKMPEKALAILAQYRKGKTAKGDYIFPELKGVPADDSFLVQRTIAFKTSAIDKLLRNNVAPLAQIEKRLTMHIARHTFGNISGDKIPIQMLQKLYRHSSITTTIGYQANFIHKDADAALDAVINF